MLAILLNEGQDTCRDNAVGLAEVVVDFWELSSAVSLRQRVLGGRGGPWRVRVMDCSSFSSSSVSVRFLGTEGAGGRDMVGRLSVYGVLL